MLYLDSSALIKRYFKEKGSSALHARFERGEEIYTSMLSFAEVQGVMGRKFREREVSPRELGILREAFFSDWLSGLSALEVNSHTMSALPNLVERYPLKASDAIHLSTAYWLRDTLRLRLGAAHALESIEFGVADKQLGKIALECGLQVFNPEDED